MLWEYLCSENLPGGAALKESVLAREFKLHRSAVREALSMATGWGIAEYIPYCGYRKKDFTLRDLIAWSELREGIEPVAARLFTRQASEAAKNHLCRIFAAQENALAEHDNDQFCRQDKLFHWHIVSNSGNNNLASAGMKCTFEILFQLNSECCESLLPVCPGNMAEFFDNISDAHWTLSCHREILFCILNGEAHSAEQQCRSHIARQTRHLYQIVGQIGKPDLPISKLMNKTKNGKVTS